MRHKQIIIPAVMVLIAATVAIGALVLTRGTSASSETEPSGSPTVVRDDSRRLTTPPDGAPVFVEFLDFECEACGAVYPAIEQLRAQYGDRVQFVVRYFPLPGHKNSERAARAVEAAYRQGQFEAMYTKMFETQSQWAEQDSPADAQFRTFAEQLGLDMAAFDADYADPAVAARVQVDVADGKALGVASTPTFFLDGQRLEPRTYDDLVNAIDAALR